MDLTQSVISDIKRTFQTEEEANVFLNTLGENSKPSDDEIDRIIRVELGEFSKLSRDVLLDVLAKHNWNYLNCYGTLISLLETKEWQEKRAHSILENLKQKLTSSEIQRAIDNNDGDVEKTAAQLLEKGRDQEEKNKDNLLENLVARFRDIKLPLILQYLNETNWNVQLTVPKLVMERRNNVVEKLRADYPTLDSETIFYAIEVNDNENRDKTRANLDQLVKDKDKDKEEKKLNSDDLKRDDKLSVEISCVEIDEVNKGNNNINNNGINVNFTSMFETYARAEAKLPGNNIPEPTVPKGLDNSQLFSSTILSPQDKQENPVTGSTTVLDKNQDGSKQIIKLEVPERVDFGEPITINWTHTGVPHQNDWVAMYAVGKSGGDYYTYQWVTPGQERIPIVFSAPNSAAANYYFCYYSNKSYVKCAESSVVKIGPSYSIDVLEYVENKTKSSNLFSVKLRVGQEGGKVQPNLWIALYPGTTKHIKSFVKYQYCSVDKEITFDVPNSGEDKVNLNLVGSDFIVSYHIKTLSIDQKPWIGIFESTEESQGNWKRYKYVDNFEGAMTIDATNLTGGNYEARLLDYQTASCHAKSLVVSRPAK